MQGEVFDVDRIEESLEQIFTQALMEPTKALWLGPKLSGVLLQRQRDDLQSIQAFVKSLKVNKQTLLCGHSDTDKS